MAGFLPLPMLAVIPRSLSMLSHSVAEGITDPDPEAAIFFLLLQFIEQGSS